MITSKQRAYLRKLGNPLETIYQIGKGGITPDMLKGISDALERRELIKARTLDNCDMTPREAAEMIAEEVGADVVSVVGSRFVLYRESEKYKTIIL